MPDVDVMWAVARRESGDYWNEFGKRFDSEEGAQRFASHLVDDSGWQPADLRLVRIERTYRTVERDDSR